MKKRTLDIINIIDRWIGTDYKCYLNYNKDYELLIATMLSAQCTDKRVNIVTKDLFKKYNTLKAFANADLKELEEDIKPTGFYHNKALNIKKCASSLIEKYNGKIPRDIDDLTSLAGVGRKTANVIRGNIYHEPSVVVDTHVKRISNKLGFTKETDPEKIEKDLMREIPKDHWILINIQLITLGREVCFARNPKCEMCKLCKYCNYYKEISKRK